MLSRKYYEAIAKLIASEKAHAYDTHSIENIAYSLAEFFSRDNPRFDSARFLKACNVRRR